MGQTELKAARRAAVQVQIEEAKAKAEKNFRAKKGDRLRTQDIYHRIPTFGILVPGEPKQWYYVECPGVENGMLVRAIEVEAWNESGSNKMPDIRTRVIADLFCETCGRTGIYDGFNARVQSEPFLPSKPPA